VQCLSIKITALNFFIWVIDLQTLEQLKAGHLGPVKRLRLSEKLTQFPTEIFSLADSLEVLDLSDNELTALPDDFARLHKLKILFLSNNLFQHLPNVLGKCASLEMISFKANKLTSIAEDAFPLQTRWLILTDNQIESLPDVMGKLSRLQKLALAGNKLSALPESMANCKNLELVRLSANQLDCLPDWLVQLPKLSWLAFSGNRFNSDLCPQTKSMLKVNLADIALQEKIGEGASGVIYRAKWLKQPAGLAADLTNIAVKLFKGDVTSDGYPIDELNCCIKAGKFPNLIKVVAQIADDTQLGLVMELIPLNYKNLGLPPSLDTCTRDTFADGTSFSSLQITKIALQMAETLTHLHERGISHGDLYAHNTMINNHASLLFGDFGASSDLSALPQLQKEAVESIEIRAFACFLEDLLTQHTADEDIVLLQQLTQLKEACLQSNQVFRPRFIEITAKLQLLLTVTAMQV